MAVAAELGSAAVGLAQSRAVPGAAPAAGGASRRLPAARLHCSPGTCYDPSRSVVVEGKNVNAAFVPFRLVNYLCPAPASLAAAVAEVAELICQEDKYEASEWVQIAASTCGAQVLLG